MIMSRFSQNPTEKMQRIDQLEPLGTATKNDVNDAIDDISEALRDIEILNKLELPASAFRLINDIQRHAYSAKVNAMNAQIKLTYGKRTEEK